MITGYTRPVTRLHIPAELDGHPVTAIATNAFRHDLRQRSILQRVTIASGVTSIGDSAFEYCDQLESIAIPDTLTHIGDSAFSSTRALRKFDLSPEHPVFEVVDGVLFNKRTHALLCCPAALEVGDLRVPEGTLAIAPHAFANCRNLTGVSLPDGLESIGKFAFTGCRSLQRVALPDSLTTIGFGAFNGCSHLSEVIGREGLTTIESYAFSGCEALTFICLLPSVTDVGADAFKGCPDLKIRR